MTFKDHIVGGNERLNEMVDVPERGREEMKKRRRKRWNKIHSKVQLCLKKKKEIKMIMRLESSFVFTILFYLYFCFYKVTNGRDEKSLRNESIRNPVVLTLVSSGSSTEKTSQ